MNPDTAALAILALANGLFDQSTPRARREDPHKRRSRGHTGTKASIGKRKADRQRRSRSR